jgi:uncharacterized protein YcbX
MSEQAGGEGGGLGAAARVARLCGTPVKGTRLRAVKEVMLGRAGAVEDRRFFVVDERGRMVNGKTLGPLQQVLCTYDHEQRRLTLELPAGSIVTDAVVQGEPLQVRFYSRPRVAREVMGPFSAALSRHLGQPVRLVEASQDGTAVDRGADGAISLISTASLARLAGEAGRRSIDARRFRMLMEVQGVEAHAEDSWVGRVLRVGEARVRLGGHVGRCLITSRDPDSGEIDLPTLDLLGAYRRGVPSTEPLPFGVYGKVLEPGRVAVGDAVVVE